jgi:ABC-type multidrug transport system fused ATPase/permease subunit
MEACHFPWLVIFNKSMIKKRENTMFKLLKYLKAYKKESICAPLFKLLEASFELLVPLVVAQIIDVGIKNQDTGYIVRMCLLMAALGLIGLVCSITAQYFSAKAAVGFASELRHGLFAHIQSLSFSEMDTIGTSTLITRLTSDINQVQSGVNLFLRLFTRSPFIVIGAMVMAFTVDAKAALVFVAVIPILCVIVFGIMLISIPIYRKVQEHLDRIVGLTRENLQGVRVIRAFCQEPQEVRKFTDGNEALVRIQLFSGRISALMNPLTYVVVNGGLIVLLYIGANRVDQGLLLQGSVVALVNYISQILVELVKFANLIITLTKAIACGNRIQAVLDTPSSMKNGASDITASFDSGNVSGSDTHNCDSGNVSTGHTPDGTDAVVFDHVQFRYQGAGADSLSDISFSVRKGETIGIIGGTGSGKTSLVSLIPRFYDVREGCVKVNGIDVRDYPLEQLRSKVGIVMQKAVLFQGTIRDNLRWGNEHATDEDMRDAIRAAQAEDVVFSAKDGLDTIVEQEGRNFSGGQKQRLTIARALVRRPEILILDDSASALDFATDARLRQAIAGLSGQMTVFIVSQRASSIQHADKIIVLEDGEIAGIGTHDELLEGCPVYQETYYSQFPKEEEM